MNAILRAVLPPLARAKLRGDIAELSRAAQDFPPRTGGEIHARHADADAPRPGRGNGAADGLFGSDAPSPFAHDAPDIAPLTPKQAVLWRELCAAAADNAAQILVRRGVGALDWGLRSRANRVNRNRLAGIYWLFIVYQLTIFRSRGIDGYDKSRDYDALAAAADALIARIAAEAQTAPTDAPPRAPWQAAQWRNQVPLEVALDIYNRVMQIVGVPLNPEARIYRVSVFTTATERDFDGRTRPAVAIAAATTDADADASGASNATQPEAAPDKPN